MVLLNGSNIGSTQPQSLPSPARGSPPGISPNKTIAGTTPELTGLGLMIQGWRQQAAKKAEQFRQRDLDGEPRRQKEQNEINEWRSKIIDSRVKKIEQQQQSSVKNAKNCGSMMGDPMIEQSRKRRSDDDYYLGTPSDGGFSCDSPDAFGVESGYCAAKNVKMTLPSDKPSPVEKNASVFIETFHLPPPLPQAHTTSKRPNMGRSNSQIPAYPIAANKPASIAHSSSFNFDMATMSAGMTAPQSGYTQVRPTDDQQSMAASSMTSLRGQMGDVALPRDIEEEFIRSLPSDLDAALTTPDLMRAIDDLEWTPSSNARASTTQQPKASIAGPPSSSTVSSGQYATATRTNMAQPGYPMQQHYPSMAHQQMQSQQHYYNMVNRSSALGAWHPQAPFAVQPSSHYANQYPMNGQEMMHSQQQQQVARPGWPQGMIGNQPGGFNHQF